MITYKHERYLAQAIESVLMQETTFPLELVIGEDCSPDGTREIVKKYAALRPDVIRPILHERNVGMGANARAVQEACRGEFIACLEGDDYWTDPRKLQRQVDWLDANPQSPMCCHNVQMIDDATGQLIRLHCLPDQKALLTLEDLLLNNPIPTCSVVCRRESWPALPPSIQRLPVQDWPSWILISRRGPVGYLDFVGGCYRLHGASVWSSQPRIAQLRKLTAIFEPLEELLGAEYRTQVQAARKNMQSRIVDDLAYAGRWSEARAEALQYLRMPPRRFSPPPGRLAFFGRILLGLPSRVMREAVIQQPA